MKRQNKYPDTQTFHFYNANPKNRFTEDCVLRAVSTGLQEDYNKVLMEMAELQTKTGHAFDGNKGVEKYLLQKGWVKCKQPKKQNGTKYTGEEFCETLQNDEVFEAPCGYACIGNNIIANIGSHHIVAIIRGKVWDTWNSTNGCIGNFYIKP